MRRQPDRDDVIGGALRRKRADESRQRLLGVRSIRLQLLQPDPLRFGLARRGRRPAALAKRDPAVCHFSNNWRSSGSLAVPARCLPLRDRFEPLALLRQTHFRTKSHRIWFPKQSLVAERKVDADIGPFAVDIRSLLRFGREIEDLLP